MSLRVVGGAGGNPAQVTSYTIPATITSNSNFSIPENVPTQETPVPVNVVITDTKTSYMDNPGVSSIQVRNLTSPAQVNALRSAAANTAAAFGLNVTIASDTATFLQQQTLQKNLAIQPVIIDAVIIPD